MSENSKNAKSDSVSLFDDEEDYWRSLEEKLRQILKSNPAEEMPSDPAYYRRLHEKIMTDVVSASLNDEDFNGKKSARTAIHSETTANSLSKNI